MSGMEDCTAALSLNHIENLTRLPKEIGKFTDLIVQTH